MLSSTEGDTAAASLLQVCVPRGADSREDCDFLPPEPGCPAAPRRWEANVLRAEPLSPRAQERRKLQVSGSPPHYGSSHTPRLAVYLPGSRCSPSSRLPRCCSADREQFTTSAAWVHSAIKHQSERAMWSTLIMLLICRMFRLCRPESPGRSVFVMPEWHLWASGSSCP
jgi:hypothetical protein